MIRIILSDEQAAQLAGVNESIELVDRAGRTIRKIPGSQQLLTEEEYVEIKRSMVSDSGSRYTTKEVLDYLKTLDVT